jgi:hypothetical protein
MGVHHSMWLWQILHRETSTPLEVRIKKYKYNLTQGLFENSKLAQHAYEEDQKILWRIDPLLSSDSVNRDRC